MTQPSHITTSGGLISTAFIENIRQAQTNQRGTQPDTFALPLEAGPDTPKSPAALETTIAETWEVLLERWDAIAAELPAPEISPARDRWILPLLRALDFQPVYQRSDIVLDDSDALRFNVSHFGWESSNDERGTTLAPAFPGGHSAGVNDEQKIHRSSFIAHRLPPPLHTVAPNVDFDARPDTATARRSAKGKSPHDMMQLFLNVSRGHRWAVLTNGLHLRLLRDYHHTYTKGYVEFDLESIFETRNFADFRAMYRMVHASRFSGEPAPSTEADTDAAEVWDSVPLEMFYRDSQAAGVQVGADLQKQVREAIETLGNGFLQHGGPLLGQLQTDSARCQQFYAELLHIVYRILFLLYAEQRGMTPQPGAPLENLYRQSYSLTALRGQAENTPLSPDAYDLWEGLKVTFKMFRQGAPDLGVYRYNGMLFAEDQTPLLDGLPSPSQGEGPGMGVSLHCRNHELLRAIRALTLIARDGVLQRISYADLNVEEIGGIYESLLDFAPRVTTAAEEVEGRTIPANTFFLDPRGTARKTSGSYYTHPSLVNALIESALVPVLEERLKAAEAQGRKGAGEKIAGAHGRTGAEEKKAGAQGRTGAGENNSPALPGSPAPHLSTTEAQEQAILSIRVCDPAMGSGHFLIAANNTLALRLAQIRTGDEYPAERHLRRARRDVLARCIYGVDLNPMAVELAKVSLWINAAVDDAPLSFLDHHLKCGNSLLGATPELLRDGIPNDAFKPVTGDDKKVAAAIRKRNKNERTGQLSLWRMTVLESETDLRQWAELNELAEDQPRLAERRYAEFRADPAYRRNKLVADLWTAAFFWPLAEDSDLIPTEELFRQAQADPQLVPGRIKEQAAQLAERHRFFHWHLEFPDVFETNEERGRETNDERGRMSDEREKDSLFSAHRFGFDVVLGNPPWDILNLQEKEFFAYRDSTVAAAPNAAARKAAIRKLKEEKPELWGEYLSELKNYDFTNKFLTGSGRYPLTARGRINTYQIFSDLARDLPAEQGRAGIIVPTGIATDYTNRDFFADLVARGHLAGLFDFENRRGIFPGVHRSYKFALLTLRGAPPPKPCLKSELCKVTQIKTTENDSG